MNIALDAVQRIQGAVAELRVAYERTNIDLSDADKLVSEIYHEIEAKSLSAVAGYKLAKRLQTALRQRRDAKVRHETLQMAISNLKAPRVDLDSRLRTIERTVTKRIESYEEYTKGWA